MLLEIAKNSTLFQNMVVNIISSIHPSIEHNIGKIEMLKKALFHCELEEIQGSYFEFGTYEGTSLFSAVKIQEKLKSNIKRNFYGFDSFDEGFKYFDESDKHPFFKEDDFKSSYAKVSKRFEKFSNVKLFKGYFEESVAGKPHKEICNYDKCAVIFIDCDLMSPALVALEFIGPILQEGSVIVLDDFWAYKGNPKLGTCGAF